MVRSKSSIAIWLSQEKLMGNCQLLWSVSTRPSSERFPRRNCRACQTAFRRCAKHVSVPLSLKQEAEGSPRNPYPNNQSHGRTRSKKDIIIAIKESCVVML